MSKPDRACPDYPNECVHPWAHARTYAEVQATQTDRIPAPRTVPTFADRLNDARACDPTDQHRHTDGLEADTRSDQQAIRELTAALERERRHVRTLMRQRDNHAAQADRLGAELGRTLDALAAIRDGQEHIDRALAAYDTTPGWPTCSAPCTLPKGHPKECDPNPQPVLGSPAGHAQDDLADRLAAALTDATNLAHTRQTPPDTRIARWRALLAEHAETQP
ncbi:hypothetical protein [Streptomyces sp.]|uniref:hypothetical protein n=1 Tax=Streptomyces sp. TaxID=1931 RepID=UPI002F946897